MRVEANERGRLHVFAVNRPAGEVAQRYEPGASGLDRLQPPQDLLADLTGAEGLSATGAELIPLADLAGLGLSGYLSEGHDIPQERLAEAKRRLDALEGYALLLLSEAFDGQSFALAETAALTHIASFDRPGTDWRSAGPLPSEAARPNTAPSISPRAARQQAQRMGGLIFAGFMIVIALILWLVLS